MTSNRTWTGGIRGGDTGGICGGEPGAAPPGLAAGEPPASKEAVPIAGSVEFRTGRAAPLIAAGASTLPAWTAHGRPRAPRARRRPWA